MSALFKPMLAATVKDTLSLKFPFMASPKLDGIRCLMRNEEAYSRTMKLIPNEYIRSKLRGYERLDGELTVGPPGAKNVYNVTNSGVMSKSGKPDFAYRVFDLVDDPHWIDFKDRYQEMLKTVKEIDCPFIVPVEHKLINNIDELLQYEGEMLMLGYEGVMLRNPKGKYKEGRSTPVDQWLMKFKRFTDDDAEIIGFGELMINNNEQTKDELGHSKRSTSKENLAGGGTLGYLTLLCPNFEQQFNIGTGLTHADREHLWKMAKEGKLIGKRIKFKYQPVGVKDVPRFPVFLGFRED